MTATVESTTFTSVYETAKTMDVDINSDGTAEINIYDNDYYDYFSGTIGRSEGITLTAAQVNQLREALS